MGASLFVTADTRKSCFLGGGGEGGLIFIPVLFSTTGFFPRSGSHLSFSRAVSKLLFSIGSMTPTTI